MGNEFTKLVKEADMYKYFRVGNKSYKHFVIEINPDNEISFIWADGSFSLFRRKLSDVEKSEFIKWVKEVFK